MPLEGKPIDEIAEADLQSLVDQERERKTIEYKRDRIGGSDGNKKEFLADVSSFANAAGGHLIIGMAEEGGLATELVGVSVDGDKEVLRLEEMIRNGIRPRIMGLESGAVPLSNGDVAIVIRTPKSWNPPHQVVFQKTFRFWGRGSNGKHPLDVDELRSIFSLSETAAERIRNFRVERIARIDAGETPVPIEDDPKLCFHLIPLSAFAAAPMMELRRFTENLAEMAPGERTSTHRHNIDGLVVHQPEKARADWYTQVFRNGIVEHVSCVHISEKEGIRFLVAKHIENYLIKYCRKLLPLIKAAEISPPIVALLTLTDFSGVKFVTQGVYGTDSGSAIDRDRIFVPSALIESYSVPVEHALRGAFDAMWNASGWPCSPFYDSEGNWKGD
jgi:hypothetical protein